MITPIYTRGMAGVVFGAFLLLGMLQLFEALYAAQGWPSMGERVAEWAQRNAWLVMLLVVLLATFLGHFYLHGLSADQLAPATPSAP